MTSAGADWKLSVDIIMRNAGVIGIAFEDKEVLKDVLHLSDTLFEGTECFLCEQVAFYYALSRTLKVGECYDLLGHYCWDNDLRDTFHRVIPSAFERYSHLPLRDRAEALYAFRPAPSRQVQLLRNLKIFTKRLGFFPKGLRRLS